MNIHYEPHPVTPERKAELRAQGYKILDAIYAPPAAKPEPAHTVESTPRKRKAVKQADEE